jgi:hypothetical protein
MSIRTIKKLSDRDLMKLYNKYTYKDTVSYTFSDIPLFALRKIKKTPFVLRTGMERPIPSPIATRIPSPITPSIPSPIRLPEGTLLQSKILSVQSVLSYSSSDDEFLEDIESKISEERVPEERIVSNLSKLPSPKELQMVKQLDMKQVLELIQERATSKESFRTTEIKNKISSILGL